MNNEQIKAEIERLKADGREIAAKAHHEDWVSIGAAPTQAMWEAYEGAKREMLATIRRWADQIGKPASFVAFDLAIEAAAARTNDTTVEAPYRAIALVQMLLDDETGRADGFTTSELEHTPA